MPTATLDAPTTPHANGATSRHVDAIVRTPMAQRTPDAPSAAPLAHGVRQPDAPSKWGAIMTWALLILCAGASVLANVAGAQPRLIAQVFAGAPPIVFLACVEVILRAQVPRLFRYQSARFIGLVVVATVSAVASYIHQVDLLVSLGEHGLIAHTLPGALDGAMLLASVTLLGLAERKRDHAHAMAQRTPDAPSAAPPMRHAHASAQEAHARTPVAQLAPDEAPRQTKRAPRNAHATEAGALIAGAYTPGASAPEVRAKLERQGHAIALRTIQNHLKKLKETGA